MTYSCLLAFCDKMAPTPLIDQSISKMNDLLKSSLTKTGVSRTLLFNAIKVDGIWASKETYNLSLLMRKKILQSWHTQQKISVIFYQSQKCPNICGYLGCWKMLDYSYFPRVRLRSSIVRMSQKCNVLGSKTTFVRIQFEINPLEFLKNQFDVT